MDRNNNNIPFRSGFVALIGRPNAGKSTLMNQAIGHKVAIMSAKPQTTRHRISGVLTRDTSQIIFIDTPGIHKPNSKLGDHMVKAAENTLREVDAVCFLIDVTAPMGPGDQYIMEKLRHLKTPVFLVINKIDQVHPHDLLPKMEAYSKVMPFHEVIPVSALEGNNVNTLLDRIVALLPEGPKYYPDDQVTDHPEQFICAELIREQVLNLTREEVPHAVAVAIESMKREPSGLIRMSALIIVERDSHKGILIGKKGETLKKIGSLARREIEMLLGDKLFLELWVKVKKDWRNRENMLRELGFRNDES